MKATILFLALLVTGCSAPRTQETPGTPTPFTHGNVTLHLKQGTTTQEEVLRLFGAPNIATTDSTGQEVWTYQKYASVSKSASSEGYFTIVVAGAGSTKTQFESSTRTMTLIIKFNASKVVSDFSSFTSNF